jgi:hypothetical protein
MDVSSADEMSLDLVGFPQNWNLEELEIRGGCTMMQHRQGLYGG